MSRGCTNMASTHGICRGCSVLVWFDVLQKVVVQTCEGAEASSGQSLGLDCIYWSWGDILELNCYLWGWQGSRRNKHEWCYCRAGKVRSKQTQASKEKQVCQAFHIPWTTLLFLKKQTVLKGYFRAPFLEPTNLVVSQLESLISKIFSVFCRLGIKFSTLCCGRNIPPFVLA